MMLEIKKGVNLAGLRPEMNVALTVCNEVYAYFDQDCMITSALDGKHSRGSLHYVGLAVDIRTYVLGELDKKEMLQILTQALGEQYDCVLESDHLHIEFQPKT